MICALMHGNRREPLRSANQCQSNTGQWLVTHSMVKSDVWCVLISSHKSLLYQDELMLALFSNQSN